MSPLDDSCKIIARVLFLSESAQHTHTHLMEEISSDDAAAVLAKAWIFSFTIRLGRINYFCRFQVVLDVFYVMYVYVVGKIKLRKM